MKTDYDKNHYEVLGVPEYASLSQINAAYLALARTYERDYDGKSNINSIEFVRIEKAHNVLSSPKDRKKYDLDLLRKRIELEIDQYVRGPGDPSIKPIHALSYPERTYWQGVAHLEAGETSQALVCFNKVLKIEKDCPIIFDLIAQAYMKNGSHAFAAKSLERASELEPENEMHILRLGRVYEAKGKLSAARRCYKTAFEMNRENALAQEQYMRGSLVLRRVSRTFALFFRCFLPDPKARTMRFADGLITRDMLARFAGFLEKKLHLLPCEMTFRFAGIC